MCPSLSAQYNDEIRLHTVRHAILQQLRKPRKARAREWEGCLLESSDACVCSLFAACRIAVLSPLRGSAAFPSALLQGLEDAIEAHFRAVAPGLRRQLTTWVQECSDPTTKQRMQEAVRASYKCSARRDCAAAPARERPWRGLTRLRGACTQMWDLNIPRVCPSAFAQVAEVMQELQRLDPGVKQP